MTTKASVKMADPVAKTATTPARARQEEALRIEYMPLAELRRAVRNPKRHADADLDASMRRFGYTAPITLDEGTGRLVAGHGRIDALERRRKAGQDAPARIQVDKAGAWFVPVVRGLSFASELEAEAYLLADNRLTELGGADEEVLGAMLAELARGDLGLDGIGWTEADAARMLDREPGDDGDGTEFGDDAADGVATITCPDCGKVFPAPPVAP